MDKLQNWLKLPPKFTTFRINTLKSFNCNILQDFLMSQASGQHSSIIPTFYLLKSDCLVLERWPEDSIDIVDDNTNNDQKEIVVDALCAAAVLRGANVFAPGVMGLPVNCKLNETVKIYGDLEGHCKRGLKVPYTGEKIFVGTGLLKMLRNELFDKGVQPRILPSEITSSLKPLKAEDLNKAEVNIIRRCQDESFSNEVEELHNRTPLERRSRLWKLLPYLDEEGFVCEDA